MSKANIIKLAVTAVIFAFSIILRVVSSKKDSPGGKKKGKTAFTAVMLISGWYFVALVVNIIKDKSIGVEVPPIEMFAPRSDITIGWYSVPETTVVGYIVLAVVLVLCVIFRIFAYPKFTEDTPKGLQNALEAVVELCDNFVTQKVGKKLTASLSPYVFGIAVYILGCAFSELFGQRPPTSDLFCTFALALMTLFMINFCGIREKKLGGRIKALASPSPVIFPMKILSDCATPVSLACRLFGNMLGGYIVMDLLKESLGGYSVGITSLAGLYFNLFHPAIQAYIFLILTLTFINEATETAEE